jgi:hypothetical protein
MLYILLIYRYHGYADIRVISQGHRHPCLAQSSAALWDRFSSEPKAKGDNPDRNHANVEALRAVAEWNTHHLPAIRYKD